MSWVRDPPAISRESAEATPVVGVDACRLCWDSGIGRWAKEAVLIHETGWSRVDERPRVLLVEDDFLIAEILMQELCDAGYAVDHAEDGAAGSSLLKALPGYVALVADIRLPGELSGWDVARLARGERSEFPVIYMSGDSAGDWSTEGVPHSTMLEKPFAPSQLVAALGLALRRG